MKICKYVLLFLLISISFNVSSQKVRLKKNKVYVDKEYVMGFALDTAISTLTLTDAIDKTVSFSRIIRLNSKNKRIRMVYINFNRFRGQAFLQGNFKDKELIRLLIREGILINKELVKDKALEFCELNSGRDIAVLKLDNEIQAELDSLRRLQMNLVLRKEKYDAQKVLLGKKYSSLVYQEEEEIEDMSYNESDESVNNNVYVRAERRPVFISKCGSLKNYEEQNRCSESSVIQFLHDNIVYPEKAKENGFQGKVFIMFVVDKQGKVGDVEVLKGIHESLDQEAVRLVESLPVFKAARQRGEPVMFRYTVPINFKLP